MSNEIKTKVKVLKINNSYRIFPKAELAIFLFGRPLNKSESKIASIFINGIECEVNFYKGKGGNTTITLPKYFASKIFGKFEDKQRKEFEINVKNIDYMEGEKYEY